MTGFVAALRVGDLKTRRSRRAPAHRARLSLAPLVGGLFMYILADPDARVAWA